MKKRLLFLAVTSLLFAFNNVNAQDAITNITAPGTVTQGEIITVSVDYVADTDSKDLNVTIKPMSGTGSYGFKRVTVSAGSGSADVSLTIDPNIPVADNAYKIVCYMTNVGGNFDSSMPQIVQNDISAVAPVIHYITINNGDVENTTAMFQDIDNENRWTIEGMWFAENNGSFFDATNSGLAAGEGRNSSQAIKSTVVNASDVSAGVVLLVGDVDISANGPGTYTFRFYAKSSAAPSGRPFWIVCNAFDLNGVDVTNATLEKVDNGGTVTFSGLEAGYIEQSVTVNIAENASGNDAQYLRLQIQHGKFNNSYWFDDFTLTGPQGTSTSINNKPVELGIDVYPNPAKTLTYIKSEKIINRISLYALSGELIMNKRVGANEYTLDVSSFSKGLYILKVANEIGTSSTKLAIR